MWIHVALAPGAKTWSIWVHVYRFITEWAYLFWPSVTHSGSTSPVPSVPVRLSPQAACLDTQDRAVPRYIPSHLLLHRTIHILSCLVTAWRGLTWYLYFLVNLSSFYSRMILREMIYTPLPMWYVVTNTWDLNPLIRLMQCLRLRLKTRKPQRQIFCLGSRKRPSVSIRFASSMVRWYSL